MTPGKEGCGRGPSDRAPLFVPVPADAAPAPAPAPRPTTYSAQPKLRVSLGGEKRSAKASAEGDDDATKRQRTGAQPADEGSTAGRKQRDTSTSPRADFEGTPRRAEYAGGSGPSSPVSAVGGHPSSPYAGSPPPFAYTSPAPGGQWVWRHEVPNPNGSYGAWAWMPAPPAAYGALPPHGTAPWPSGPPTPVPPPGYSGPPGYHPGTPAAAAPTAGRDPFGAAVAAAAAHPQYAYAPLPYLPYGQPQGYGQRYDGAARPPHAHFPQPLLAARHDPRDARPRPAGEPPKGPPKDPLTQMAIAINKRITAASHAVEIFGIVEKEYQWFDTVCLATAMHKLANLRGAPNLHAQIVQAPEFFRLKQLILERRSEFTARNIANTLWSLAKINHHPGEAFLQAMAEEVKEKVADGNAQNVANVLWAFATLGYNPGDEVLDVLAAAVEAKLDDFTSQNMSNAVLAFAKLEYRPSDSCLEGLARTALQRIKTFSPQALSNTLWGLSKLDIKADELMEGIGQEARSQLYEYNSQNLANSVWAYANIGVNPGADLLQDFARAAIQKMPEFSPQNISNFLWAFAKLGVKSRELFVEAGRHGTRVMHTFTPQSIANMIWAFATAEQCPDGAFLQALVGQALRLLPDFSPQNLSNTAWALATLKECEPVRLLYRGLLASIANEVTRRLLEPAAADDFSRQHLANLVWALATLEYDPGKRSLLALADALVNRADLCNPQEVSNSVWAFAKLGHYDGQLMNTMASEAARRIEEFSQQNLSNLAWAYAKLAHLDEDLMTAIADRAEEMAGELSLQHVTNIIWAYSSLKWSTPSLMTTLVAEVKARMAGQQFNLQQLSNLLWSLAIAECCDSQIWAACIDQLGALDIPFVDLPSEALTQIFQAYMLMLAEAPHDQWPIPEQLLALGQNAWVQSTKRITISEFHSEVSRMLSAMGVEHAIEHLTDDHLFSVDIALPEERIAIEVDGPHHFTANTFRPLGEMYCRHTLLKARGWRVVSVAFYHWSGESEENRQALLRRIIAEARAAPIPEVHASQLVMAQRLEVLRLGFEARLAEWQAAAGTRQGASDRQAARQGSAPLGGAPHYQQAPQPAHPQPDQQPNQQVRSLSRAGSAAAPVMPPRPPSREGLHPSYSMQQQLAQQAQAQAQAQQRGLAAAGGLFSPQGPPVATPRVPREPPPAASSAGLAQGMSLPQSSGLLHGAALQQQSAGLAQGGYGVPQQLGLAQGGFGQQSSGLTQQQQTLEQLQQLLSAKEAALQLLNSLAAQQVAPQQLGGEQPDVSLPQASQPIQPAVAYPGSSHLPTAGLLAQSSSAAAALGRRGLSPLFLQQPGAGQPAAASAFAAAQQQQQQQQALGAALGLDPETAARLLQAQAQVQASRSASGASLGRSGSLSAASTASSSSASASGSQPSQRGLGQGSAPGYGPTQ